MDSKFHRRAGVCILLLLSACSTPRGGGIGPGYFLQAALGQLQISSRARPNDQVLHDGRISLKVQHALEEVPAIKHYGESMGLRPARNYEEYSDLKRSAVVWVVSACEPLKFEAARWSFPIVGSFSYLGWFDREKGERFREQLENQGHDADVRPATAYSTLGWFRDPLLSTMIPDEDHFGELVEVVLHESVHATLHLKGQSTLNESLAQFLGEKLAADYLTAQGEAGASRLSSYRRLLDRDRSRKERLRKAYLELDALYRSPRSEGEKRAEKTRVIDQLKKQLEWPEHRRLNNATLVQFSTYEASPEGFEDLWQACGKSAKRFLTAVERWAATDARVREGRELDRVDLDEALRTMRTGCR